MANTVVVLGAGVGGLTAATRLRELLPERDRVVLVDRSFDGVLGLSLLWVMRGWRDAEEVRVKPRELPGIDMRLGHVESIDLKARAVLTDRGVLTYDALVIALGAQLAPSRIPNLTTAADAGVAGEFYTLSGAAHLRNRFLDVDTGRVAVLVAGVPFKCPAAPFEGALLIADLLRERGVRDAVTIDTFTPDPLPMAVAGPDVGKALVAMMEEHGIGFHPGRTIDRIDLAGRRMLFSDETDEPFDFLVAVPPHRPAAAVVSTGLGPNGWIPVDARTLATAVPAVWAIGDNAAVTLPNGKPLPKAAVFAEAEAEVAAAGVARHFGYDGPEPWFSGAGSCYVEVGGGRAAKGAGMFLDPPAPAVVLHEPSPEFHEEKRQQERDWLARWNA
ncbi:NAD(P)/FAD-dependent oxidoreductase [Micromonospora sp. NPDC000442]|uniref:NAD(P)/FAD-dependent oxidoreductase n=1 Tax=Micromonospora sp. NPDC000442 TaxID=3364217 RepID=UPI00369B4FF2